MCPCAPLCGMSDALSLFKRYLVCVCVFIYHVMNYSSYTYMNRKDCNFTVLMP